MLKLKFLNEGGRYCQDRLQCYALDAGPQRYLLETRSLRRAEPAHGLDLVEVGGLRPELNTLSTGDALDKLLDWAERLAVALGHRVPATPVAVVLNDPHQPAPVQG